MISYNNQDFGAYNLACLRQVAEKMGSLREKVVFIGGTVLPLLTTGPTGLKIRKSKDVDMLEDFSSKDELYAFEDELWERGFKKKSTGVICRWILADIRVDVLPADPDVVGFDNPWLREVMHHPMIAALGRSLSVKITNEPCFLGAKFNAFNQRGKGDYIKSNDIYDVLVLLVGRPGLDQEITASASPALRAFLVQEIKKLWEQTNALRDFSAKVTSENGNGARLLAPTAACMEKIFLQ